MDNSSQILRNLSNDANEVLTSKTNQSIDEREADLIRRRRLERLANNSTPPRTTDTQDDNNNNNI